MHIRSHTHILLYCRSNRFCWNLSHNVSWIPEFFQIYWTPKPNKNIIGKTSPKTPNLWRFRQIKQIVLQNSYIYSQILRISPVSFVKLSIQWMTLIIHINKKYDYQGRKDLSLSCWARNLNRLKDVRKPYWVWKALDKHVVPLKMCSMLFILSVYSLDSCMKCFPIPLRWRATEKLLPGFEFLERACFVFNDIALKEKLESDWLKFTMDCFWWIIWPCFFSSCNSLNYVLFNLLCLQVNISSRFSQS